MQYKKDPGHENRFSDLILEKFLAANFHELLYERNMLKMYTMVALNFAQSIQIKDKFCISRQGGNGSNFVDKIW